MTIITTLEVGTSHLKVAAIAIVSEPWEPEQELLPVTLPCGKGTTGSNGRNYGYSLKTKREIKTKKNNGMRTHLKRPDGAWLA